MDTSETNSICHLILNRPKKLNSMNVKFWDEFRHFFKTLKHNKNVKVVVITGSGKSFTAGLDLVDGPNLAFAGDQARSALKFLDLVTEMQESFTSIEKCGKIVLVGIHGGGGIDLITACDIRYCTNDAKFSVKEVDIGIAADVGTLQRLPKVVGNQSWVKEICLTGRYFSGEEAVTHGLCSKTFDNKEEMTKNLFLLAKTLSLKSPIALIGTKKILDYSRDHSVEDGLEMVAVWNSSMLNTEDVGVAISASMAKSKPVFSKL
ncbi:putative enoyl CoA hydratase [Lobulomyces angularis]|nr:putative enoyl CoA hydratase [Lobulomyces angularis]